jgi:hypothetical protein
MDALSVVESAPSPPDFVSVIGTLLPIAPCGRSSLWYLRQRVRVSCGAQQVRDNR